jgi:hypothetical protein
MTKLIIVHGEKPKRNGKIHPAFIERLKVAINLTKKRKI